MTSASFFLALDTSGPVGSVAVSRGGDVLGRVLMTRKAGHAGGLLAAVDGALEEAGVDRDELDAIVVGSGPGSFTGVRVAAATAKGLAHALGRPLHAVSSLQAAALALDPPDHDPVGAAGTRVRYALFDARGDRVYGACYEIGDGRVATLVAPHAGEIVDVLDGDFPSETVFVGDGAERHRATLDSDGRIVAPTDPEPSLADGLVRALGAAPSPVPVDDLRSWVPDYVRASSAERLWPV